jgi:hypothetical protein
MCLWGQPGSMLMTPGLTQRYSWTAPYRSLWSHLITLSPWVNNKCTIPWSMYYTSVGWEWVHEGLHRSPSRNKDPDWSMATPLCSTLVLSHSCDPHSRFQWNLVAFTVHWQISRSAKSQFSYLLSLFTSPNNPVPNTSCVSQLHHPFKIYTRLKSQHPYSCRILQSLIRIYPHFLCSTWKHPGRTCEYSKGGNGVYYR